MYFGPLGGVQHRVCLFWPKTILWDLFLEYLRNVALLRGVAFKYIFCALDIKPVKSHLPELSVSFLTYITSTSTPPTNKNWLSLSCSHLRLFLPNHYVFIKWVPHHFAIPRVTVQHNSTQSISSQRFYCGQECEFEEAPVVCFIALSCYMGSHQENKPWF